MRLMEPSSDLVPEALVIFSLEGQRYALPLTSVQHTIRMVGITPVPGAPEFVLGVVDLGGAVVPVVDLRARFNHPSRAVRLSDHLIVATAAERTVALAVDTTEGVIETSAENYVPAGEIMPGFECVEGVVKLTEGLVLIHDLERLLSVEELATVDRTVNAASTSDGLETPAASAEPKPRRPKR